MEEKRMFMSAEEFLEDGKEREAELRNLVRLEDGHVGFPEYDYWISLDRINTSEKALIWVAHLLEKEWVAPDMLLRMLRLVHRHTGVKIYGAV